jgi:hypothetical protein
LVNGFVKAADLQAPVGGCDGLLRDDFPDGAPAIALKGIG